MLYESGWTTAIERSLALAPIEFRAAYFVGAPGIAVALAILGWHMEYAPVAFCSPVFKKSAGVIHTAFVLDGPVKETLRWIRAFLG